jgi:hypothetical protein
MRWRIREKNDYSGDNESYQHPGLAGTTGAGNRTADPRIFLLCRHHISSIRIPNSSDFSNYGINVTLIIGGYCD